MRKDKLVFRRTLYVRDLKSSWGVVPGDGKLPAEAVVSSDDRAPDGAQGVLGGESDVPTAAVLDQPVGDLPSDVADSEIVHEDILDPCKPKDRSRTICETVE